jgi:hypothetical protein
MEKNPGTLNKTPNAVLMPLTGSKNRFFAPNGSRNGRSGSTALWKISYPGSGWELIIHTQVLSIEHFRLKTKSR